MAPQENGHSRASNAPERSWHGSCSSCARSSRRRRQGTASRAIAVVAKGEVMLRVVDVFADLLELEQIDCIFTVPGGTAVPLLEAISRRPVRVVVSKDEGGAAFAADGYAWASGKPGVVVT